MRTLALRDAKATFSAVVQAAENGESTTITKHGRPVAVIVPAHGAAPTRKPRNEGLIEHLMSVPEGLDLTREPWTMRDIEL